MVGRINSRNLKKYVALVKSQNSYSVCLSWLISCEDTQWPAILQNLRNMSLYIFKVLFLINCQSFSYLISRVMCQVMPVRYCPILNFLIEDLCPIILLWEGLAIITVRKTFPNNLPFCMTHILVLFSKEMNGNWFRWLSCDCFILFSFKFFVYSPFCCLLKALNVSPFLLS